MNAQHEGGGHVCPWWFAYTFDNALRRLVHSPDRLFAGLVERGMTAADLGCGMGYFSLALAGIVGPGGTVVAVDLQKKMLQVMERRARRAGLSDRIRARLCSAEDLRLEEDLDFALAFWMVHEVPSPVRFFSQVRERLRTPTSSILYAEPSFHVSSTLFEEICASAEGAGFRRREPPKVRFSRAALLERG